MWVCAPVCWDQCWILLELELEVVVSHLIRVLGMGLGSSGWAVHALNWQVIFPVPYILPYSHQHPELLLPASFSPKVCSSVMTVVKQLWVLPEDRLATHGKWRVFLAMGGNEDCRKGVQVDRAGFFSLRLRVKRQCKERPLFVAETWLETALDPYIFPFLLSHEFFLLHPHLAGQRHVCPSAWHPYCCLLVSILPVDLSLGSAVWQSGFGQVTYLLDCGSSTTDKIWVISLWIEIVHICC